MGTQSQTQTEARGGSRFTPLRVGLLQRKCACSGSATLGGECEECRKEREGASLGSARTLQRKAASETEPTQVPPVVYDVLRSPGQPLDAATCAFFEPRFGHDFSRVRVHTDSKAADSARAVNALAYTVGRDIVFGSHQYAPASGNGRRLLAHELAHEVQQSASAETISDRLVISEPGHNYERGAEEAAQKVNNGQKVVSSHIRTLPLLARKPIEPREEPYKPSKMSEAYWKLPAVERAKVNEEVDRIFKEETRVTRQLDWNDPKDRPLARRWLRIRDTVMAKSPVAAKPEPHPAEPTREHAAPVVPPSPATVPCKPTPIDLTKIPDVMDAKGWTKGAALLRSWFSKPAAVVPSYAAADSTTVTMPWVLGFSRAKTVFDSIFSEKIYANKPAQTEITKLLKLLGKDRGGTVDFSLPVTDLDPKYYINFRAVEAVELDDLGASLGKFVFRVVVGGRVDKEAGKDGAPDQFKVEITKVGVYVRDSFDFEGFQALGCWNVCTNEVGRVTCGGGERVYNSNFREWRTANSKGGDFLVYSDVSAKPLPSPEVFYLR